MCRSDLSGAGDLHDELAVFRVLAERTLRQEYLQRISQPHSTPSDIRRSRLFLMIFSDSISGCRPSSQW